MGKVGYLFTRIKSMNYKQMFQVINNIHTKTKKNRVFLFFDIINCGIKYQAGYMDYSLFEMYDLNKEQRKTIITRGINNSIVKKYNNPEYKKYFANKILFNQKFAKYIHRDWMEVTDSNFDEFKEFTKKHSSIVIKPIDLSCGKGIEIVKINSKNLKSTYENILETKRTLIEEVATQCEEISKLHPTSINTVRAVTLNKQLVVAFLRIGNENNVVDNFNHGGLVAPVNVDTGTIDYKALDKKSILYENHPITNEPIIGFKIPKWDKVKKLVETASKEIPEMGYVGWDVCISDSGPLLIEANEFPGHDVYQLPPHRSNGIGLYPKFKEAMAKEIDDNENSNRN